MANRRTQSAPRRTCRDASVLGQVPVRWQLFADHLRKDFADRQRCHAVRQIPRATTGAARPGATQIAKPASIASAYTASCVFENAVRRVAARKSAPTEAVPTRRWPRWSTSGPSPSTAEVVMRCWSDANFAARLQHKASKHNRCNTRTAAIDGEGAIPLASKAALQCPALSMEANDVPS
jgi:hypothetical protein